MLYALYEITDLTGLLKLHLICKLSHPFLKILNYMTVIAIQETYGLLYVIVVVLF